MTGFAISPDVPPQSDGDDFLFQYSVVVPNVAAIRALVGKDGDVATARGRITPGDNLGGLYEVDITDTTSADNGYTIIVAANGVRWKLFNGFRTVATDFNYDAANFSDQGVLIYGGTADCYAAIMEALSTGPRVQISGLALVNTQIVVPDGKYIDILPGAAILLNTSTFTGARNSTTGVGILFNGNANGGGVSGGAIRPNTYVDGLPLVAARAVSSTGVRFSRTDFSGFSQATGIVSVDSCNDTAITGCIFRDSTTNTLANAQLSGVVIDDNKIAGVVSDRTRILNCAFLRLTVGSTFLTANGYQTDGITTEFGTLGTIVDGCEFDTLGEGYDDWGLGGSTTGCVLRNCKIFALKLIHGAQGNVKTGNQIYNAGLAGILLSAQNTDTTAVQENWVYGNLVRDMDPDGMWAGHDSACILVSDGTATGSLVPANNILGPNVLDPGVNGHYAILRTASTGLGNEFPNIHFVRKGTVAYVGDNTSGLGRITATNRTLMRASLGTPQTIALSSSAKILLDTKQFDDRTEMDVVTNHQWTCQIPGVYSVRGQITLGTVVTTGVIGSIEVRKNGGLAMKVAVAMTTSTTYEINDELVMAAGDVLELWFTNGDTHPVTANNGIPATAMSIQQA